LLAFDTFFSTQAAVGDEMKREAARGEMMVEARSLADLVDCKHRYDFLSLQSRLDVIGEVLTTALQSVATPGFSFAGSLRDIFPVAGAAAPVSGGRGEEAAAAAASPIGAAAPPTTPTASARPDAGLLDAAHLLMNVSTPLAVGATPGGANMQLQAAEKRSGKLLPHSTSAKQRLRADSLEFIRGKLADCGGDIMQMAGRPGVGAWRPRSAKIYLPGHPAPECGRRAFFERD